jgi:hypothetical protein
LLVILPSSRTASQPGDPRGVEPAAAPSVAKLPFAPGEELTFAAKIGVFGASGAAVSKVLHPVELNGERVYPLHFHYRGRLLLVGLENETRSWLSPASLGTHGFEIREKTPFSSIDDKFSIDHRSRRWISVKGDSGELSGDSPQDELSLTYFVRTMELKDTNVVSLSHFMADRSPVQVRLLRREETEVPAGRFRTVVVETRTPAGKRSGDDRIVTIHLTDDARRLPVRIDKQVKLGTLVLSLRCGLVAPHDTAGQSDLKKCS